MPRTSRTLFLTVFLCMTPLSIHAGEAEITYSATLADVDHELSMAFETPHTKWATPYAQGAVRVLFFAPWFQGSTDAREIIELMQRFDLDADAVYWQKGPNRLVGDGNPRWYVDEAAGTKRVLRLMAKPYDVYFLNNITLDALPEEVQQQIRTHVADGSGLVMIGADVSPLEGTVEISSKPSEPANARLFSNGSGRVAILPPREIMSFELGWEVTFDYQMQEQGRALLWAADRASSMTLEVVSSPELQRRDLPAQVQLKWSAAAQGTTITTRLRRWDGWTMDLDSTYAADGGAVALELPVVRAGHYHIDAFARTKDGSETWATTPVTITADRQITAVHLERDWSEVNETITGTVELGVSPVRSRLIQVRLMDRSDRILARQDVPEGKAEFAFHIEPWMPMLLRVEAAVSDDNGETSAAYAYLRVTKRHQDQFNFIVWNYPGGDLAPYGADSMTQNGASAILQGGEPPLLLSNSNLSFIPYAASFRPSSHTVTAMLEPDGALKGGCVYDDVKRGEEVARAVENSQTTREHGTLVYSLGDENAVRASCLSPLCLEAYRNWLQNEYGAIGALNASWGTSFVSFNDVVLETKGDLPAEDAPKWFKEFFAQRQQKDRTDNEGGDEEQIHLGNINDEMRALQAENYPRWYDRQAFQSYTYVQWCKRFVDAFHKLDPMARTGFEGTDSFSLRRLTTRSRQGGDLDLFMREMDYFGPYEGPANEVVRSIMPRGFPSGNWIGYSLDGDVLLEKYWDQVTNHLNLVQWWRWDNLDGYHGFLSPTLSPFPATQDLIEDTRIVREGLGTLLMNCAMEDDAVAILYSMPSTHIAHFDGNPTYGLLKRDHAIWHDLLHEAGVQFRYVTDRMLRLDEFDASRFKVLILPLSFAIGPKEAEVIREFARNGGTVIADVRPGMYDGHCKPLEQGILDDVFGIRRTGKQDAMDIDRMEVNGDINGTPVAMRWGNWEGKDIYPEMRIDPTVELTTGKELGKAFPIHYWYGLNNPVCIVNEFGAGRAILLNFSVYAASAEPLIKGLLEACNVSAEIGINRPNGKELTGVEVTRWRNGSDQLIALLGDKHGQATVTLPSINYVYDIRAGEALGQASKFTTTLRPHRASFFFLTKTEPNFEASLNKESFLPGETAWLSVRTSNADSTHCVKLRVSQPDGAPAPWHDSSILVGRSTAVELPLAFNDGPGVWRIHIEDLLTFQTIELPLTVLYQKENP